MAARAAVLPVLSADCGLDALRRSDVIVLNEDTWAALTGCEKLDPGRRVLLQKGVKAMCVLRPGKGYCYMAPGVILCEEGVVPPQSLPASDVVPLFARALQAGLSRGAGVERALHEAGRALTTAE